MKYFLTLLILLLTLAGCSLDKAHKNQTKYSFVDQNQQTIQFWSDFNTLEVSAEKSKDIDKVTLIMFLNLSSENVKKYIFSINHLNKTFPKAYIIGILTQHYPQEEVDKYIKTNNINFTILNPNDKKNMFIDFAHKVNTDQTSTSNVEQNSDLEIPYFVLYDKHGKKYQTYTGIIVEEMFASDITALLKSH